MLWEAWQKETRPPVPAQQQQQGRGHPGARHRAREAGESRCHTRRASGGCRPRRRGADRRTRADPRQHRLPERGDRPARRRHRPRRAPALQRQPGSEEEARPARPRAPLRGAERADRRRAAEPPHALHAPRARVQARRRPGRDRGEARSDHARGRAGGEDADIPAIELRRRHRAGDHERHRRAACHPGVLPPDARRQGARRRQGDAADLHRCRGLHRAGEVRKDTVRRHREGEGAVREERRQRLDRDGAALLRLGAAAAGKDAARVLHREDQRRLLPRRGEDPAGGDRARRDGDGHDAALRRAARSRTT